MSTAPNDAARPVYQRRCTLHAYCDWVAISFAEYEEAASHEGQYAYRILYPATDYDALREEVERLQMLCYEISRDCNACANERNEQRARAEAAEAALDDFIEAAEHYFNTGTADALRAVLNDQINAQGENK